MAEDPVSEASGGGATMGRRGVKAVAAASAGFVLLVLATGQFIMALDSSVMNVSIATVAEDVGTTVTGIQNNPNVPPEVKSQATVQLAAGIPFISNADLEQAMKDAGRSEEVTQAALDANRQARVEGLDAALAVLALIAVVALFFTGRIPRKPPGSEPEPEEAPAPA